MTAAIELAVLFFAGLGVCVTLDLAFKVLTRWWHRYRVRRIRERSEHLARRLNPPAAPYKLEIIPRPSEMPKIIWPPFDVDRCIAEMETEFKIRPTRSGHPPEPKKI